MSRNLDKLRDAVKVAARVTAQLRAAGVPNDQINQILHQQGLLTGNMRLKDPDEPGFFGKIAGGIGDVVKKAAPLAAFIPGVGPLAAAGIGALGGVLGQFNDADGFKGVLGDALGGAVTGGVGAFGLGKLRGLGGAAIGLPGAGGGGGGFSLKNLLSGVVGDGQGGFDPGKILSGVGGVASGVAGASALSRSRRLTDEALNFSRDEFAGRAPFRAAALSSLQRAQQPQVRSLDELFRDPTQPFA